MRVAPLRQAMWDAIPMVPCYAIEKATGLTFSRRFAPPEGLRREAEALADRAREVFPNRYQAWKIDDLAKLYLEEKLRGASPE